MAVLICPKCGGGNINVQMVQTREKTMTKKRGCLARIGRFIMIVCTGGLWLIFGKKKTVSSTLHLHKKVAFCNECGHSFRVR